jgi:hypothetical protein
MPCQAISLPSPPAGPGLALPGFPGSVFPVIPPIKLPDGIPEDLLYILDLLNFLIPPGKLIPALNPNFAKDIFDGIMKLLDHFMPFLMLYKFFLPILHLIICIIEVLCALTNPFALIAALENLFINCLPPFLNLFPIFALILMIISLLILILKLIEYIIQQILLFILTLIRQIKALFNAMMLTNVASVLAIAQKLGFLMCIFQNLLVLMAFFAIIIQAFKDILGLVFAIPPCGSGNNSNCCNAQYCPAIVSNGSYTSSTGTLEYSSEVGMQTSVILNPTLSPSEDGYYMTIDTYQESWQIFDSSQVDRVGDSLLTPAPLSFWNISNAYDVYDMFNMDGYTAADGYIVPVYFPTSGTFNETTSSSQAAYTIDLKISNYNPSDYGLTGNIQDISITGCIVTAPPTQILTTTDSSGAQILQLQPNGVLNITGGSGVLANGNSIDGYVNNNYPYQYVVSLEDGYFASYDMTQWTYQAPKLNDLIHYAPTYVAPSPNAPLPKTKTLSNVTYTFNPILPTLVGANLVTVGCMPSLAASKAFINNVVFNNIGPQTQQLKDLVNSPSFPDPAACQTCMLNAIADLRANITLQGVADFQTATSVCLAQLQNDTENALTQAIGIGYNPAKSTFSISPNIQFTTEAITVTVNLNENNGMPITSGLPASVAENIASQIVAYATFGNVGPFTYDGYQVFTANLTSPWPGSGSIKIAFQNQIICVDTLPIPGNPAVPSSTIPGQRTLQSLDYQFVYVPAVITVPATESVPTGEGDTIGSPQRNNGG